MNRIELDNRKTSAKILRINGWHVMPIENKTQYGTPDLNAAKKFILGLELALSVEIWIEFKIVEEWPKKSITAIKIKHFTQEQKAWMSLRIKQNSNCFIIVQIEEEHFLYRVTTNVLDCLGTSWTKQQMYNHCSSVCKNLKEVLSSMEEEIINWI